MEETPYPFPRPQPFSATPGGPEIVVGAKFETHDKLGALEKLAKILGIYQEAPAVQAVTVNQVNVGGDNALEAARRLAFALAKLSNTPGVGRAIEGDVRRSAPRSRENWGRSLGRPRRLGRSAAISTT